MGYSFYVFHGGGGGVFRVVTIVSRRDSKRIYFAIVVHVPLCCPEAKRSPLAPLIAPYTHI